MKYVTYLADGAPQAGVLSGNSIISLAAAGFTDLIDVVAGGAAARAKVEALLASGPTGIPASSAKLCAPIPKAPKIICVGLNYRDHAIESGMEIPKVPTIFNKFQTSVIGPGDSIVLPARSEKPDYEAEFAFVIGRGGRYISAANWKDHVFGYMNVNDVSARDYQLATTQWLMGKTFDTFCPMGPWLVTADEIADPHNLRISLTINGETLQDSNTRELIFDIPTLVEYLSSVFTLQSGDVVSTGTPPGVGFARKPPRYLRGGDNVVVSTEGLGDLANPVVTE
ncbi:MAG: fumarylacetoacetate hydrolase family protein [Acidobacteria bacterium]|nr:fumarylacetoacetate hydrolase family protein [Acidobacteriota bacterium]